jgi:hypothetical protein
MHFLEIEHLPMIMRGTYAQYSSHTQNMLSAKKLIFYVGIKLND